MVNLPDDGQDASETLPNAALVGEGDSNVDAPEGDENSPVEDQDTENALPDAAPVGEGDPTVEAPGSEA